MTTSMRTPTDGAHASTPVSELPLAPRRLRDIPLLVNFLTAFAGQTAIPVTALRDAGPIYRMPFPQLPQPLKAYFAESFMDDFAGETVIITDPRLVRELYHQPPGALDHEAWKKALIYVLGGQSPFLLSGRSHVRARRAVAAELTPTRVEGYRHGMGTVLDEMIDELPLNTAVGLHDFHTRFTQEVILRVVFGWDCADLDELKTALYEAQQYYAKPFGGRLLPYMLAGALTLRRRGGPRDFTGRPDIPPRLLAREAHRLRTRTDALIDRKIAELRARPNDSAAARLIAYGDAENPRWTDKQLRDTIRTFIVAGHDTSVLAYDWAVQYLLHNPGPRAEVVAEARAAVTDRYAQAANIEALRMASPLTGAIPYPATQDIAVGGYRIRKNTFVFALSSPVHMNEELYPEPEQFRPERWLENRPDPYGFLAFGVTGRNPHRCPGSTFYLTDAVVLLHRLFGRLDLEPVSANVDAPHFLYGTLCRPKGDTEVVIHKRRAAQEVPWYRPGESDPLTPLKESLLPPQPDGDHELQCPVRSVDNIRES
ncbi:cytochrome P450 [Mycobacteroides franklinii]|uniref:Putative bifunctional P-450/NADPH-P450 reductase 2 n=1 Tax=Mycobacteroides franklinii TaxID=948102 RepID=A0A4R8R403_9MYCO|nr:cytochrome P450 [Mycobacteroides franklinii]TDZ45778.1 putative bifunctional P-450/NADPH-P450 reductase 2 [Mycobacteroides franklinii]TDZ49268.1 putative bifunctional P-450/NADPH-P450 reductase 2 [Mycobacteroides franklinii]TDZ59448.1 putative bifunctional P-450/NADPH-P450 reductase 2 [Mycobacteroides franklinii]TDZ66963.1 putative bifunctional P-450/NADPH-P450 reductase 2 [Mycobacteroides franklinii]TDZ72887.1 putative bifunctional P-450/NADPH-P450 reductase 2 [Mycobacteroides franklinii]